jgi:hypothetical protein
MAMKVDALNLYDERFDAVLSRDERPPLGPGHLQPQAPPEIPGALRHEQQHRAPASRVHRKSEKGTETVLGSSPQIDNPCLPPPHLVILGLDPRIS